MTAILASAPALPLHKAGPYVAAAYIVFIALLLIYLGIMSVRIARNERAMQDLKREILEHKNAEDTRKHEEPVS